jgi:hypothetical protein
MDGKSPRGRRKYRRDLEECGLNGYRDLFFLKRGEPLASIETEFMCRLSKCRVERMSCQLGIKNWLP